MRTLALIILTALCLQGKAQNLRIQKQVQTYTAISAVAITALFIIAEASNRSNTRQVWNGCGIALGGMVASHITVGIYLGKKSKNNYRCRYQFRK
jgi:ascorbate-specific PTS system EIIC-type component UlaA